jgi:uncharacterized membrane protein
VVSTLIWAALTVGLFAWNYFQAGSMFLGLRFTDRLLGFPLNAGWLGLAVTLYCLARWLVGRRKRAPR